MKIFVIFWFLYKYRNFPRDAPYVMKRNFKFLGACLAAICAASLLLLIVLPGRTYVEKDIIIHKSPEEIYVVLSNFNSWNAWVPWLEIDTSTKVLVMGPKGQIGHSWNWYSTHPKVGNGSLVLVDWVPNYSLKYQITYKDHAPVFCGFELDEEGDFTKVKWYADKDTKQGSAFNSAFGGFIGILFASEFEKDMEAGLVGLKTHLEHK